MTDARLPERWLNDRRLLRLSDAGYRLHLTAMTWSVSNRTDGAIDADDVALMPSVQADKAGELVAAGLWQHRGNGWLIADYDSSQTSRHELEVLENLRRRDREKKARQRDRRDGDSSEVPRDVPPGLSPGTAKDRTGQARTGLGQEEPTQPERASEPPNGEAGFDPWQDFAAPLYEAER